MLQNQSGLAFGNYQLLRPIGWGGMSVVYHALQTAPDTDILAPGNVSEVAVKVMSTNKEDSLSFYRRFQREVRVASALTHPHVLPVCDYGIDKNTLYLVMPYMRFGTLEHRLKEQKVLSLTETLAIAFQIGQALDYAHSRNIIHRDVKPHNIMIGDEQQYFLADFGLVKILDGSTRLTMSGHIIGTPAYMSPEQANGIELDRRSDVYSLGIVLYECLVGRLPYPFETQAQAIGQHLNAQAINPSSVNPRFPKAVKNVLMKALEKDPDKRYQSVLEMVEALQSAAAHCKPAVRDYPLVTMEQIQHSRTESASRIKVTTKKTKDHSWSWSMVGVMLLAFMLALMLQSRLLRPEVVLAIIIQQVDAVQNSFKQELGVEQVVLDQPLVERAVVLPQRPVVMTTNSLNDEGTIQTSATPTPETGESERGIASLGEGDTEVATNQSELDDEINTTDSEENNPSLGQGNGNQNGSSAETGNGNSSGSTGNSNGASGQGNGNTTSEGGSDTTNGSGNGNGNDQASDPQTDTGSGTTNGGGNGNGNDQSSETQSDTGSGTSGGDSSANGGSDNNGSGNGNPNK